MSRIQVEKTITETADQFTAVGIDVSRDHLDVHVLPSGRQCRFGNDAEGVAHLIGVCREAGAGLVVLEATGRYHRLAHERLHAAGLATCIANPARIRNFARSVGRLAKTDRIPFGRLLRNRLPGNATRGFWRNTATGCVLP